VPRAVPEPGLRRRPSPWGWLVAGSTAILGVVALTLVVWWVASRETRVASYSVRGSLNGVTLDLAEADADIVGGAVGGVGVRRTDRFAFGHRAVASRAVSGGVLRISSRCPESVMGTCSARYRLTVPDNVPVTIRTGSGNVSISRFRGSARIDTTAGDIAVGAFCGFALQARAETGDVRAEAACPLDRMELRSASGNVNVTVPPGRYRVDADSDSGRRAVRGLRSADDAPFQIQALSSSGNVDVEAAR
jgi:hypothetical protein